MQRDILGFKCTKCGHIHYPNRTLCRKCAGNEFTPVALPKKGKLLTYTELYTLPGDFEVVTLSLGIIELENGTRVTGQIQIPKPEIGMKVECTVEKVRVDGYNEHFGMVFRPA